MRIITFNDVGTAWQIFWLNFLCPLDNLPATILNYDNCQYMNDKSMRTGQLRTLRLSIYCTNKMGSKIHNKY